MNVIVEGTVMEKIISTFEGESKKKIRLYQKGVKNLIDVSVEDPTYGTAKEGTPIKLKCTIGTYQMNGNVGMYAKEIS